MRFSNFLFPESRDPAQDGTILDQVMDEVRLTERLGSTHPARHLSSSWAAAASRS